MKKTYIAPQANIMKLHAATLIAMSGLNNSEADQNQYKDENQNIWDNEF